jgi:hypothetical protein
MSSVVQVADFSKWPSKTESVSRWCRTLQLQSGVCKQSLGGVIDVLVGIPANQMCATSHWVVWIDALLGINVHLEQTEQSCAGPKPAP